MTLKSIHIKEDKLRVISQVSYSNMILYIFIFGITCYFTPILGQVIIPNSEAFCFQFTWLGPSFMSNSSIKFECPKSKNIPCLRPYIITHNSQVPDTTWILENFNSTDIICPLKTGACVKYSYIYDNTILNTTYFCGKMTADRTNPVTNGCYTHTVNGYTIEACACKSVIGRPPCNLSPSYSLSSTFIFLILALMIYQTSWFF